MEIGKLEGEVYEQENEYAGTFESGNPCKEGYQDFD